VSGHTQSEIRSWAEEWVCDIGRPRQLFIGSPRRDLPSIDKR
jgi:hypothetical protein